MSRIICNKSFQCGHRKGESERGFRCGGAMPHTREGCEDCPVDRSAVCVPVFSYYHHLALMHRTEAERNGGDSRGCEVIHDYMDVVWQQMDEQERSAAARLCDTIEDFDGADSNARLGDRA